MRQFKPRHMITISFLHFFLFKLFQCRLFVAFYYLSLLSFHSFNSTPHYPAYPFPLLSFSFLLTSLYSYTSNHLLCSLSLPNPLLLPPPPSPLTHTHAYTHVTPHHTRYSYNKYSTIQHNRVDCPTVDIIQISGIDNITSLVSILSRKRDKYNSI